jgi:hypothetical protein
MEIQPDVRSEVSYSYGVHPASWLAYAYVQNLFRLLYSTRTKQFLASA